MEAHAEVQPPSAPPSGPADLAPLQQPKVEADTVKQEEAQPAIATVTDEQVVARLRALLPEVDLESTSERQLRKRLEGDLGADLSDRKAIVRGEINAYLAAHEAQDEDEEEEEEDEKEEEEEEEEELLAAAASSKRKAGGGGGGGGGFGSQLSDAMAAFLGEPSMSRPQVVKRLWLYIKEHRLQDPANKRRIIPDEKMRTLFTEPLDMFSMNKQLSRHCYTDDSGGASKPRPKKKPKLDADGNVERKPGGFQKAYRVSDRIAAWVGKDTISRPEFTKFFWDYCKSNGLQDPADRRHILCDARLQQLTGEARISGFGFQKYFQDDFLKD